MISENKILHSHYPVIAYCIVTAITARYYIKKLKWLTLCSLNRFKLNFVPAILWYVTFDIPKFDVVSVRL